MTAVYVLLAAAAGIGLATPFIALGVAAYRSLREDRQIENLKRRNAR